jgi:hypothetical protein
MALLQNKRLLVQQLLQPEPVLLVQLLGGPNALQRLGCLGESDEAIEQCRCDSTGVVQGQAQTVVIGCGRQGGVRRIGGLRSQQCREPLGQIQGREGHRLRLQPLLVGHRRGPAIADPGVDGADLEVASEGQALNRGGAQAIKSRAMGEVARDHGGGDAELFRQIALRSAATRPAYLNQSVIDHLAETLGGEILAAQDLSFCVHPRFLAPRQEV